jgi:5-methyltetrahydrofolate--homocysteine methyltransferase
VLAFRELGDRVVGALGRFSPWRAVSPHTYKRRGRAKLAPLGSRPVNRVDTLAAVPSFTDRLANGSVLLADGATGTNYQDMGMEPGVAPEEWVFDEPERVADLHRRFAQAGSDLVLTCSFGASPVRLLDGPLAGRARELNARAAQLARDAVGDDVLVAGSIGPSGQLVEPLGPLGHDDAVAGFAEQAQALVDGGVDLLVLETFFALDEALWAAEAVRAVTDLPLVASFSFDQGTRTMMGLSPADVVAAVEPLGVAAVGANCGRSLQDTAVLVSEFAAADSDIPLWIKPNAGVPQVTADGVVYPEDPDAFAAQVATFADAGARVLGGCCGSTPEHLAALGRALRG